MVDDDDSAMTIKWNAVNKWVNDGMESTDGI